MGAITQQVHAKLLKKRKTVAVAESCTGGILSSLLTGLPGSSGYFILGIVAYSNKAKVGLLKIPASTIKRFGAVSAQVATLMSENIRKIAGSDFGIGITGIAGPKGATLGKPVGTIFISVSTKNKAFCKKYNLTKSRAQIRQKAAKISLKMIGGCLEAL